MRPAQAQSLVDVGGSDRATLAGVVRFSELSCRFGRQNVGSSRVRLTETRRKWFNKRRLTTQNRLIKGNHSKRTEGLPP